MLHSIYCSDRRETYSKTGNRSTAEPDISPFIAKLLYSGHDARGTRCIPAACTSESPRSSRRRGYGHTRLWFGRLDFRRLLLESARTQGYGQNHTCCPPERSAALRHSLYLWKRPVGTALGPAAEKNPE